MLKALLRSSINATRRAVAWNLQDLSPPSEKSLFKFSSQNDLKLWEVYGDSEHGGFSNALLQSNGGIGIFSGHLSEALSSNAAVKIKRSGFSGFRTIEGLGHLDLEPFDMICLRLKGDGRCYISNLRTESWVGGLTEAEDSTWQAFIFAPKNEWCELQIPLSRYLPTWKGKLLYSKTEMNPARITGLGFSLTSTGGPEGLVHGPGPFRLELDWIKALRVG